MQTVWRTKLNWNANRDTTRESTSPYVVTSCAGGLPTLLRPVTACLPIVSLVCNLARNYPHTMPFYSQNTSNRRVARIVRYFPLPFSLSLLSLLRFRQRKVFFSVSRGKLRVSYVTMDFSLSLLRSLEREFIEFDRGYNALVCCCGFTVEHSRPRRRE